ncbi:MAG: TraR/DksA family transcriptional regulator [Ilumatobacter sp.]
MAAAKKSAKKKTAAKKAAAKKTAAKKAPAKKATGAKQPAVKKTATKKTATKKTATKKAVATKPAAKKKVASKQAASKPAAAKSVAAKKSPSTKTPAKKVATKKAASKKAAAKKAVVNKPAPKKPVSKKATTKKSSSRNSPLLSNEVPDVHEIPAPRGTTKDGIAYTKDFDVKFLKVQRDELLARKASEIKRATRLEDEAESLIEDGEMGDVQFDDEGGEGDTMVVQRDLDRLLSSQARQTVEEIDLALARIEAGTYGYSEVSGLPIPRERLEALPETTVLAAEKVSGAGRR